MNHSKLIEEIQELLGRQAIGPPLSQQEADRLEQCLGMLHQAASPKRNAEPEEKHIWVRVHDESSQSKTEPQKEFVSVARSGTKDFLKGAGAALVCIPLLCLMMVGCCAVGKWLAEQLVLPELPMVFAAACMIPGILLVLSAKELADWLDQTLLSYDEEDEI